MPQPLHIIGGGLAGCEAAWSAAEAGLAVMLHEMRPIRGPFAHQTDALAELVCSNSFRSDDAQGSAIGLLHAEMRRLSSLVMSAADEHKLPAGGALAVDRDGFSAAITAYAYETVANKKISAGAAATAASENQAQSRMNPVGASLGMLARGADGLALWRRDEASILN